MGTTTITNEEYRILIAAKHTLTLITALMDKEFQEDETSTYINGKRYMDIINCFWGVVENESIGQRGDF